MAAPHAGGPEAAPPQRGPAARMHRSSKAEAGVRTETPSLVDCLSDMAMTRLYAPPCLYTIAPELLERIAMYVVAGQEAHKPSPGLAGLICACKRFHASLAPGNNTVLWSNIFRERFDIAAPIRRLGPGYTHPTNLVSELRHRVYSLRRIQVCYIHPETIAYDLWIVYLMLLESDGRNDAYLLKNDYATRFVQTIMAAKDQAPRDHPANWFTDTSVASLCAWILWFTRSKEDIAAETYEQRQIWNHFFQPFIIAGFRYPSFYAPDTHQSIPPEPLQEQYTNMFAPSPDGMRPNLHILPYFGRTIKLAAPVLTPVAMLIAHARYERGLCSANPAAPIPEGQLLGPTEADVAEYEANARVVMPPRRDWSKPEEPSRAHDHDWARLVSCVDPLDINQPLLHASVYQPGTLSGCFSGTIVTPDLAGFLGVAHDPTFAPGSVQWAGRPLHFRLREHHAIEGPPVIVGLDELQWGDDVFNAWLPRGMNMVETEDELIMDMQDDEGNAQRSRYATYHTGRAEPYSPRWTSIRQSMLDSMDETDYVEEGEPDEDGCVEFVQRTPNFIKDIIITGETDGRHGDAWGHYTFVGRVRPWDGLVVLLRTPTFAQDASHGVGRWVFRGYLHAGNFVGRWREAPLHDTASRLTYEGAFVTARAPVQW